MRTKLETRKAKETQERISAFIKTWKAKDSLKAQLVALARKERQEQDRNNWVGNGQLLPTLNKEHAEAFSMSAYCSERRAVNLFLDRF